MIGVGGSAWPPKSHFDFFPLVGVIISLVVARFVLRFPLTIPVTILAIVAGSAWAWTVEVWGWPPTALAGVVVVLILAMLTSHPWLSRRPGGMD